MRLTKNFYLNEFIPQSVLNQYGNSSIWFIDFKIVLISQFIRDYFNKPTYVNGIFEDVFYDESGFRSPYSNIGTYFSQHKFGRAADIKVLDHSPFEVKTCIKTEFKSMHSKFRELGLTTMEKDTHSWTHFDVRRTYQYDLFIV